MSEPQPAPSRRTLLARILGAAAVVPLLGRQTLMQAQETVLNPEPEPTQAKPSIQPPLHSVPRRG